MVSIFRCFSSLIVFTLGSVSIAHASVIDFEKPVYVVGNLAGQNGWQQAEGNPTTATILGPQGGSISGSQSASIVGAAGATGGAVVSAFVRQATRFQGDGTPAPDFNVRFLFRKTQSDGFGGLHIHNSSTRPSSAGVRVNGNVIEALQAGETYVRLGPYEIADIVEFSLDIDLDTRVYQVRMRNVRLGEQGFTPLTDPALALDTVLHEGELVMSISGQRGQTIFDNITLTPISDDTSSSE